MLKLLRQPDETMLIVVQALQRFAISKFILTHPFFKAEVRALESTAPPAESKQWEAEIKTLRENAMKIIEMSPDIPDQARGILMNITDGGQLADFLATNLNVDIAQKQALLEELDVQRNASRPCRRTSPGNLRSRRSSRSCRRIWRRSFRTHSAARIFASN